MSRNYFIERPSVLAAFALALSVAIAAPLGSPKAQDAASDEAAAESATPAEPAPADDASNAPDEGSAPAEQSAEAPSAPASPGTSETKAEAPADAAEKAAATEKPAEPDKSKAAAADPAASPDDYYSKRAKEMLKADNAAVDMAPHPLAAAHPDQLVVVCEAGCGRGKPAQIVYMAPRPVAVTANEGSMVPASVSGADDGSGIACTAGCYGKSKKIYGRQGGALTSAAATSGSSWITTVSSEQKTSTEAAAKDHSVKTASKNGGSGDWMARINLDRSKDAPAAPAAATAPATSEPQASSDQGVAQKPAGNGATSKPPKVTSSEPAKPAEAKTDGAMDAAKTDPAASAGAAPAAAAGPTAPAVAEPVVTAAPVNTAAAEAPVADAAKAEPQAADANTVAPAASPSAANPSSVAAAEPPAESANTPAATPAEPSVATPSADAAAAPAEKTVVASLDTPEVAAVPAPAAEAAAAPAAPEASSAPDAVAKPEAAATESPAAAPAAEAAPAADAAPAPQKVAALDEKPVNLEGKDPEVNAAMRKARVGLPDFFRAMDNPGPGETNFSLKVAIPGNGTVEHFWLVDVKREGDKLVGKINNEPEFVRHIEMGQKYEFTEARVTDWLFKRNGKMVGNETLRPLLKRMAKEEAAPYWAMYEKP